jgi:hypothetical protein
LALKEWQVITGKCFDWFDVVHDIGEIRHNNELVWAATARQISSIQRLEDCFESANAMCLFQARRY